MNSQSSRNAPTILCISSYEKGQAFLEEAAHLGANVILLTTDKLREADWPRDTLASIETMPDEAPAHEVLRVVTRLAREQRIDRVVPLDEFDLEAAALVREHLRLPGMSQSATYLFRDKLAMRTSARAAGVRVPRFTAVHYRPAVHEFLQAAPGPWFLKPRTSASAIGIHRIETEAQLWRTLDDLGNEATNFLLEQFISGDVFHVEGITSGGAVLLGLPFQYGQPPFKTMHEGGVFSTRSLDPASPVAAALIEAHTHIIGALGLVSGVSHTEFIRSESESESEDGLIYFLETAARVGGAYIAEVVEFATGLNPWREWARMECAALFGKLYSLPERHPGFAGSVICLARQDEPDTGAFNDPEVVFRLHKHHHAGLIVKADTPARVQSLVETYTARFQNDFCTSLPAPDKPTS